MKKLVLMVVAIAAISFASTGFQSCNGGAADSDSVKDSTATEEVTEAPAETPAPVATDSTANDSVAENA